MNNPDPSTRHFSKMADILTLIKNETRMDTNVIWSHYDTPQDLIDELGAKILRVRANDYSVLSDLYILFLPTGSFQDISISNGWVHEFLGLAEKFNNLYVKLSPEK